ncbi:hypothetical protein RRG08_052983 [Elysia crispata]|uniref:Uncharacterized protein n=1 Tax=Elysia crispata TaxID=231223 RepID=A0AAE0ZJW3_9GAST|nr:hypothetical protein RRG08_052983 [Elysia crispata]
MPQHGSGISRRNGSPFITLNTGRHNTGFMKRLALSHLSPEFYESQTIWPDGSRCYLVECSGVVGLDGEDERKERRRTMSQTDSIVRLRYAGGWGRGLRPLKFGPGEL